MLMGTFFFGGEEVFELCIELIKVKFQNKNTCF